MIQISKIFVTSALAMLCLSTTVYAATPPTQDLGNLNQDNQLYSAYMEEIQKSIDMSALGTESLFQTNANVDSICVLNYQFETLKSDMQTKGFGEMSTLKKPVFETGYSKDIQTLFYESYGQSVKKIELKQPEIPASFDVEQMMKDAQASRQSALGDFKKSEAYRTTVNVISIGKVFELTSALKSTQGEIDSSELQTRLDSLYGTAEASHQANLPDVNLDALLEEYKRNANPNVAGSDASNNNANAQAAFDKYKTEMSAIVSAHQLKERFTGVK